MEAGEELFGEPASKLGSRGSEGIRSGVRGYKPRGTKVLDSGYEVRGTKVFKPGYEGIRSGERGY